MKSDFEEFAHRVNNLLGTIAVQAEVARASDSLEAHRDALRFIVESADKTRDELRRLRRGSAPADSTDA